MECLGAGIFRMWPLVSGTLVCILFTPLLAGSHLEFSAERLLFRALAAWWALNSNFTPLKTLRCLHFVQPFPYQSLHWNWQMLQWEKGSQMMAHTALLFTVGSWSLKSLLPWQLSDAFKQVF